MHGQDGSPHTTRPHVSLKPDEIWSKDKIHKMLEILSNSFDPDANKRKSYISTMKKINWEDLAKKVGEDTSGFECHEVFNKMLSRLCNIKSLEQLIGECRECLDDDDMFKKVNLDEVNGWKCFLKEQQQLGQVS